MSRDAQAHALYNAILDEGDEGTLGVGPSAGAKLVERALRANLEWTEEDRAWLKVAATGIFYVSLFFLYFFFIK